MGLLDKFKKKTEGKEKVVEKAAKVKDVKKPSSANLPTGKAGATEGKKPSMKELYGDKKVDKAERAQEGKGSKKAVKTVKKYGNAHKILVKPIVTEKASVLGTENKYVFAVAPRANKIEIAKAIDEVYGIKPTAINIVKMHGKQIRFGRTRGKTKDWKKAIITLPEGQSIKIYEGV